MTANLSHSNPKSKGKWININHSKSMGKSNTSECAFCHYTAHLLLDCPIRKCRQCGITHPRHYESDCPKNSKNTGPQNRTHAVAGSIVTDNTASGSSPGLMELMRRNQELMEQIMSGAMGMNSQHSTSSCNSCLFDSGCCNHMTPCTDGFVSKKPPQHFTSVRTADNTGLPVSFSGNVSTPHIQLPGVLNIPKLSLSLVSVAQLLESNLNILFHSSGCIVQDPKTKQILGLDRKVGRMFEVVYLRLSLPSSNLVASVSNSSSFELWHARLGTLSQYSCPGTSPQNGRAEHKHRHILDTVRTLLIYAKCPERFWGEAVFTAVYAINRHPTPLLKHKSPYEALYDILPAYELLKVWGSACFCLHISRHVTFWEHVPFSSISKFRESPTFTTPFFTDVSVSLDSLQSDIILPPPVVPPQSEFASLSESPAAQPASSSFHDQYQTSAPSAQPTSEVPAESLAPGMSQSQNVRRSDGVRQVPSHLRDYHVYATLLSNHEPTSYKEASSNPDWQKAMDEELQALDKAQTWEFVPLPPGKSPIGSKWVFKIKTKSDGSIDRYKAHLVAKGFNQEYGIDYEEIFAPVARVTSST
ncbi:hypothetical protein L6452_12207 [Arctium lappa]|uniref:Uncharacterized protein n=1 Tax=Arctium lappa TaxID=4217 RepID=A0ACB9DQS0_ARCLA|nr:hypothetical protein L6452_12207 [Arctium lappa]